MGVVGGNTRLFEEVGVLNLSAIHRVVNSEIKLL